jgi:5-(carboxyamino)imidazole ribonucleotide synthase
MNSESLNSATLGILGGGQLGKMLIQAAMNYDCRIHVLDPDRDAPCYPYCHEFTWGALSDFDAVYRFGKRVDLLTIEIENVNVAALKKLRDEGLPVFPQPEIIEIIQDKGKQKLFLQEHSIPTAEFALVESKEELLEFRGFHPFVQKLRLTGYDGRGVHKVMTDHDRAAAFDQPSVIETLVAVEREISVIVARSASGDTQVFPAIEMVFHPKANLVEYLVAPARVSRDVSERAVAIALDAAKAFGIVGLMAVEMFVAGDGDVLVNEVAPRPHNSGHHTIEANTTSQFEQHLRAIFGEPLGATSMKSPAVMLNLLGESGYEGPARYEGLEKAMTVEGASVHLYGKRLTRPFRKMGHITVLAHDTDSALQKARSIHQQVRVIA